MKLARGVEYQLGDHPAGDVFRAPWRRAVPSLVVWLMLVFAALLWFASIGEVDIRQISDIGLVSEATPVMLVGIGLLALAFTLSLRLDPFSPGTTLAATLLLIATIHGLPAFVEDAPRFSVAYLHAGFTDVIAQEGRLLPNLDARFSWPIFFSFGALLTQMAGIGNAIALQPWAAIVANLLYLGPLLIIFGSLSIDRRHVWTATFLFMGVNWIGQDYYAPQAFNFLLYLVILAILLRWFHRPEMPRWIENVVGWLDRHWTSLRAPMRHLGSAAAVPPNAPATPRQRAMLVAILVLLVGVSVASHPLTPFAILAAVTALTLLRRTELPGLPVLIAIAIGLWISYMTVSFMAGHVVGLLNDIGAPGETAGANVGRRLTGSPGHLFVVQFRLVATLLFWLAATLGALRRFRHGVLDLDAMALAAIPFGLMMLQAYGGELLLRIYLFSSPFMAFLAAGLVFPAPGRALSSRATAIVAVSVAIMLLALMVTKHGNERADAISANEVAAVEWLYVAAPDRSVVGFVTQGGILRYKHLGHYRFRQVAAGFITGDSQLMIDELDHGDHCGYFFLSRSQAASVALYNGIGAAEWQHDLETILASGHFDEIYRSTDATVLLATPAPAECRGP